MNNAADEMAQHSLTYSLSDNETHIYIHPYNQITCSTLSVSEWAELKWMQFAAQCNDTRMCLHWES